MERQEFKDRTSFLGEDDHAHYEDWFEPAYMCAATVDKDDFCAMLKDERVRKFVMSVSGAIVAYEKSAKELAASRRRLEDGVQEMADKFHALRKAISLIQSTCDRAIA